MMSLNQIRGLAAAVEAADRTGLLDRLAGQPATISELADDLAIDPESTSRVIDVLRAFDLIEHDGDRLRLAAALRHELEGPEGIPPRGGIWQRAPEFLRSGTAPEGSRTDEQRGRTYAQIVERLSRWFKPAADRLADIVVPLFETSPEPRILDAGAGGGIWSLALLARDGRARAVALDLAPVLPVYMAAAESLGLHDRVELLAGSYHQLPLPQATFDVTLAASILHLERPEAARSLVARLAEALAPGGTMVVVDMLSDGSGDHERSRAVYALGLALRVRDGYPHREETIHGWLCDAGLEDIQLARLSEDIQGLAALTAKRRR